jgi:flagellar hook-associated protein 1 FlgK
MMGLYGTLNLGTRALQTQSQGLAVAGQNLANVNNPAYTRQRLLVQTTGALPSALGSQGTGVSAVAIQRIHDSLLERQIQGEASVSGFWTANQNALQAAQTNLGEALDGTTRNANGTTSAVGAQSTLATDLDGLFNEFQNLASAPASLAQRGVLLSKAQNLAAQFNQTDGRLASLNGTLNDSVTADVGQATELLQSVARLNEQIRRAESGASGSANDLRDLRQQKIETLAGLTNVETAEDPDGQVNVSVGGNLLVSGQQVLATLETYAAGGGQRLVRTSTGTALTLTGGSVQGTIDARDGALATLRGNLDTLAKTLATEVNTVHAAGFNLSGGTGADFFTGTSAGTLKVNAALVGNPALLQASGNPAAAGDNRTAQALASLAYQPLAALGGQTFAASYARTVIGVGEALATANGQVSDQQLVAGMLQTQRSAVSGVSIDEEMTDLVRYQKAFQASARIISTVDELLNEVINMKR